jgi:hypothetical protein
MAWIWVIGAYATIRWDKRETIMDETTLSSWQKEIRKAILRLGLPEKP